MPHHISNIKNSSRDFFRMLYRSLLGRSHLNRVSWLRSSPLIASHPSTIGSAGSIIPACGSKTDSRDFAVVMAGSPLFVTDLSKPFDFSEIQFVLSEQVCSHMYYAHILRLRSMHYSRLSERPKRVPGS
jgi:hypothetical protein